MLNDSTIARKYGFTNETIMCMFLPNTYEVYWTVTPNEFFDTMHGWYKKFWTEERKQKAAAIGLTPIQAQIMASIVEAETKNQTKSQELQGYI
jgi:UPF0755 protein